jgi:lipoprotein-releasing system permease protein
MAEPTGARPFAAFEWMLSLRYLRARRKEGFVSVIAGFSFVGITLGVATLIIVMAVMNGFRQELLGKILGLNGHLLIEPLQYPLTDWEAVADRIGKIDGIRIAAPIVDGEALAASPLATTGPLASNGVLVRGIRGADLTKLPAIAPNIRGGTLEAFDQAQGVVIGRRLAERLALRPGDGLMLIAPRGAVTPMGTMPRIKTYKVAAIFEIGMAQYDSRMVFMPLAEAQAYFGRAGDVTAVSVYTDDPDRIDRFRRLTATAVTRPVRIVDWTETNAPLFTALQVERNVMFLILTLIVLVAALNIASGLVMLVRDKVADIAILRTMGVTQGAIMRVFVMTGASIGFAGTLTGFVVGAVVCRNMEAIHQFLLRLFHVDVFKSEVYLLSHMPASMNAGETAAVVVMALVLSLLAAFYPSWRAARLDPIEGLRYG